MTPPTLRSALAGSAWGPSRATAGPVPAGDPFRLRPAVLPPPSLGRIGDLEVRLAADAGEVRRAQRVRYKVFFEHGAAIPEPASALQRRDLCPFDAACDHLVVIDHAALDRRPASGHFGSRRPRIVGTYRLLRQEAAERHGGFCTAGEFDLAPLLARHPHESFLELGRACVLPRYRAKRTIELLWRGIWAYVQQHRIDVLIGCASFEGTDPDALIPALSALRHFAPAAPDWQALPVAGRASATLLLPAGHLDRREALAGLPPLIKGYFRAGARFAEGVVVDRAFGTTDVLAILPLAELDARYRGRLDACRPDPR